ncbi:MAG: choline ABC transporter ATP-binding protein [Hyphomicrobiales bacterium]
MPHISFDSVDIVFGDARTEALRRLDEGQSRDEILKATGAVVGVADATLQVEQGEICVLMGLSGSGKSTLLRAVNGLNKVSRGHVWVRHRGEMVDIVAASPDQLRAVRTESVAMVFQQFALLPWRTVRENVGFGLELRGMASAERDMIVDQKLKMVQLDEWANKYGHELSGGMQQRVGLARAFATDADLLLMDEPFSALDPLIRTKLQDELLSLQRNLKKTILFVSHDLDEAMKIGNKIAIMEGGRIVQWGTPEEIILRPANAYVAEFVAHMNPMNVLKVSAIMRRPVDCVWNKANLFLDPDLAIQLVLNQDQTPASAHSGNQTIPLVSNHPENRAEYGNSDGIMVISDRTSLRQVIEFRRRSKFPLIVTGDAGQVVGVCDDAEIYSALLR